MEHITIAASRHPSSGQFVKVPKMSTGKNVSLPTMHAAPVTKMLLKGSMQKPSNISKIPFNKLAAVI